MRFKLQIYSDSPDTEAMTPDIENATTGMPIISVTNLYKAFGENKVLRDFSFSLSEGECAAVVGRSGSGKSVLIKCIIGLMEPDSGKIEVFGKNIPELSHDELNEVRKATGFLFQNNALYDSMTVRENLEFSLRRHRRGLGYQEVNNLVEEALNNVGLPHTVDMLPAELSGGMSKRIALARTIILKPKVILYDEPTTGLDPITGKEISSLINEIQAKYRTSSIVISHDLHCVEAVANRVAMLIDGRCHATGSLDELKRMNDPKVKAYFE